MQAEVLISPVEAGKACLVYIIQDGIVRVCDPPVALLVARYGKLGALSVNQKGIQPQDDYSCNAKGYH